MSPLFVHSESWERDAPSNLATDLISDTIRVSVDIHALFATKRMIVQVWKIEDVQQVRPDLSALQAWQVLQEVELRLDDSTGINREVLKIVADHLFRETTE